MEVIRAESLGMCFGVRDALHMTQQVTDPTRVTVHGQLVHNQQVLHQLADRGFHQQRISPSEELPSTDTILITAHGISQAQRQRFLDAGKRLIDTTCPLVQRVHQAACQLQQEDRHVVVIGRRDHVEVEGIIEDLNHYTVFQQPDEVTPIAAERLGVISQTTTPPDVMEAICRQLQICNPQADISVIDTVCDPTRRRQAALRRLLEQVDSVVVVGGNNSNNTQQLIRLCHQHHRPAIHVQGYEDLDRRWFADCRVVGLTAGTSTLHETVDQVHQALLEFDGGEV